MKVFGTIAGLFAVGFFGYSLMASGMGKQCPIQAAMSSGQTSECCPVASFDESEPVATLAVANTTQAEQLGDGCKKGEGDKGGCDKGDKLGDGCCKKGKGDGGDKSDKLGDGCDKGKGDKGGCDKGDKLGDGCKKGKGDGDGCDKGDKLCGDGCKKGDKPKDELVAVGGQEI